MTLAQVRAAIAALVAGVPGISGVAPVYDYYRHATTEAETLALLRGANQERPHWWSVSPAAENPIELQLRGACQDAMYRFVIHGFYALQDAVASEKAFLTIAEGVFTALRGDLNLGATVRYGDAPPVMVEHDFRQVGTAGILCHHVSFRVSYLSQVQG